jgi:hypothetical protein
VDIQGFDLAGARVLIPSELQDIAELNLRRGEASTGTQRGREGRADLIELLPLSVEAGESKP